MTHPATPDDALVAAVQDAVDAQLPRIRAKLTNDNADTLDNAGHTTAAEFLRDTITS
jgi:hypothetical protein